MEQIQPILKARYLIKCILLVFTLSASLMLNAQEKKVKTDTAKTDSVKIRQLDDVVIRNTRKMIERKVDRTVVNLSGQSTLNGVDAFELLERLPGVRLSNDGGINLLGKGATVYVDGKPTYLSGNDLMAYLRTLSVTQLSKIELMPNPPAKYDAAGSGGIINIFTKKDGAPGYNAGLNLNGGSGQYRKINGSANFNYRTGKINFFLNAGAGAPKDFNEFNGTRVFINDQQQTQSILEQQSRSEYTRDNNSLKLGADYYASKNTTFGLIVNLNRNQVREDGLNTNQMYAPTHQLDSSVTVLSQTNNIFKSAAINLNMTHQFDSLGTELSVDVDRSHFDLSGEQLFSNNALSPSGTLLSNFSIRGDLPRQIDIYAAKTDFSKSFHGYQFGAGVKFSKVKTDNIAAYFFDRGAGEQPDYNRSNTFLYSEEISAAYAELSKEYGKFGLKVGLRAEKTRSEGNQLGNQIIPDSTFKRNYSNLFPTVYLSWKPGTSGKHQFYLNFGRRINRPGYDKLNPFLTTVQRYNQESGNPFLSPDFARTIEFSHSYNDQLNTNLYYSKLTNISSQITTVSNDIYIKRPVNSGNISIAGAMITYNRNITKWWNTDVNLNPERVSLQLNFDGIKVDTAFLSYSINWFNKLTLSKSLTGEIVLNYGGPSFSGQESTKGMMALRAGLRKTLMNGNMSIGLSGSDLFYSAISKGNVVNVKNSAASYRRSKDSRSVMLSLSYRISRNAKANKRLRDRNGVRDEQKRVGEL
jgi:hypothetical protein